MRVAYHAAATARRCGGSRPRRTSILNTKCMMFNKQFMISMQISSFYHFIILSFCKKLGIPDEPVSDRCLRRFCINNDELCITNDELCITNDELCINNDEFCIKNDELCINNDEFCIKNDEFCRCLRRRAPVRKSSVFNGRIFISY